MQIQMPVDAQTLRASFTPIANFAYQLDCVSNVQHGCAGRADYIKLWRETLKIDPESSPEIKRWVAVREQQTRLTESKSGDDWPYGRIYMPHRVLTAGLGARDLTDYQSRLALVMPDVSVPETQALVAKLYAPFESWWNSSAKPQGEARALAFIAAITSETIVQEVNNIFTLLGSPEAAKTIATVHLMFRPGVLNPNDTSGQNMGIESFAEFLASDLESDRLSVILHEYAHFMFSTIPKEKGLQLKASIIKAGGVLGGTLWGLLNEAQASALGNGRVARSYMSTETFGKYEAAKDSFYANNLIDGAGKALLPVFDEMLANRKSIFDSDFPERYVNAVRTRLGQTLTAPSGILSEVKLINEPIFGDRYAYDASRVKRPSSMWAEALICCEAAFKKQMQAWQSSTRMIIIPLKSIEKVSGIPESLHRKMITARVNSLSIIGVEMNESQALLIVIAANDNAGATAALEALMKEPTLVTKVWAIVKK
jgi:hypothetical protein